MGEVLSAEGKDYEEYSSKGTGRTIQKAEHRNAGWQVIAFPTHARTMEIKSVAVGVGSGGTGRERNAMVRPNTTVWQGSGCL